MNNIHPIFQQILKPFCPEPYDGMYQDPKDGVFVRISGSSVCFIDHGQHSQITMTEQELAKYVPKLKRL